MVARWLGSVVVVLVCVGALVFGGGVAVAAAPEAPEVSVEQPVGASEAVVRGVLNPLAVAPGEAGSYEFLYREGAGCEGGSAAPVPAGLMLGFEHEEVSETLPGLTPGTEYTVCLRAEDAGGATVGPAVSFTTLAVKPSIDAEGTTNVSATSADLTARIDPNGAATTYHVEYGTTTGYGTTAPVPDAVVGSGTVAKPVSQTIAGLSANTTYHWRIVATSAAGTVASSDQTFVDDTSGAGLPDGRAYELVTPALKNGALIDEVFGAGALWKPQIARSGMDVIAPSTQCFAGAQSCTADRRREGEAYEFARTAGQGWVTHALASPAGATPGANSLWAADAETHATLFSALTPSDGNEDFFTRQADGSISDVGPLGESPEGSVAGSGGNFAKLDSQVLVATNSFSHVFYEGKELWSFDGEPETASSVYEYVGAGNARPLSVGVTGGQGSTSLIGGCGTGIGRGPQSPPSHYGSLSADGRTVYFTETCGRLGNGELYARVDGERPDAHTVAISSSVPASCVSVECRTAPGGSGALEGASSDGSRAFFTSTQQLTDNASQDTGEAGVYCATAGGGGCNLYESVCAEPCGTPGEEPAARERRLIDVSEGAKTAGGPRVQGVMAISPDGSHVYFVARSVLTGGQENQNHEQAQDGKDNLYVYADGQPLRFIATLPASDEAPFPREYEWSEGIGLANVTPDGRFLVFLSHGALTPDDTRGEEGAPAQVYRYDSQAGALVRISIGERGFNDNGNAGIGDAYIAPSYTNGYSLGVGPARANPTMSDDGSYVFFESPVALAPGALDDVQVGTPAVRLEYGQNIYEYHDGNVSLISDGKDTTPIGGATSSPRLLGSDGSGADVFFATNDQLTSQDTDTQLDYYDARICTSGDPCFTPPPPPSVCSEEACHGAPPASVAGQTPGSEGFTGVGNLAPPGGQASGSPVKPRSLTRAQKLARTLRVCRAKHGSRRAVCEKRARRQLAALRRAKRAGYERRAK
jgi:hypothetical protein